MGFLDFLSATPKKACQPKALDRVHLIVHPGDGLREDNVASEEMLLQKIATRAISLDQRREIAVVLLQMNHKEWQRVNDPSFSGKERVLAAAIAQVQAEIPKNVIVVPNAPSVIRPFLDHTFDDLREKINELGFAINPDTDLLSYGEMVTKCVPLATHYFKQHFELKQTPTIDTNCTDVLIDGNAAQWQRSGMSLSFAEANNRGVFRYIPMEEKRSA